MAEDGSNAVGSQASVPGRVHLETVEQRRERQEWEHRSVGRHFPNPGDVVYCRPSISIHPADDGRGIPGRSAGDVHSALVEEFHFARRLFQEARAVEVVAGRETCERSGEIVGENTEGWYELEVKHRLRELAEACVAQRVSHGPPQPWTHGFDTNTGKRF